MKIYLVGERARDRIDMALAMLRERHGDELDNAVVCLKINGEVVTITEDAVEFSDEKTAPRGTDLAIARERPRYWDGYLFKHWCGVRRK